MENYLSLVRVSAAILFGALGTVFLLSTGWGLVIAPFWIAGMMKLGSL